TSASRRRRTCSGRASPTRVSTPRSRYTPPRTVGACPTPTSTTRSKPSAPGAVCSRCSRRRWPDTALARSRAEGPPRPARPLRTTVQVERLPQQERLEALVPQVAIEPPFAVLEEPDVREAAGADRRSVIPIHDVVVAVHEDHVVPVDGVRHRQHGQRIVLPEVLGPERADRVAAGQRRAAVHHQPGIFRIDGRERVAVVPVVGLRPPFGELLNMLSGHGRVVRLERLVPEIALEAPYAAVVRP